MKPTASNLRKQAWNSLTGRWGTAIGTCIVASILGGASGSTFNFDFSSFTSNTTISDTEISQIISEGSSISEIYSSLASFLPFITNAIVTLTFAAILTSIVRFVIGSIVQVGYSQFNLDIIDLKKAEFKKIFSFFKNWANAFLTNLLKTLYISLWSLLFIIPGIIATYRYSMTPFILTENPDLSPDEAIARSKELMKGNKWRLFCLYFSFIGWDILCALTLGILSFWVAPYKHAAEAAFYRSIVPAPLEVNEEFDIND